MKMDRDHERQELQDKVAKCYRLAREFPDGITNKNLRDLAAELEHQIRDLDRQTSLTPLRKTLNRRRGCPFLRASFGYAAFLIGLIGAQAV